MKEVEIPGGTAQFREPGVDEMPGRAVKLIKAAAAAAVSQLSDYPEILANSVPPRYEDDDGNEREETFQEREERLEPLAGLKFTTEQAMAWDNLREATVVATLKSWTLPRRLPTLESIGDLPDELYQALLGAVGGVSASDMEDSFDATAMPKDLGSTEVPTGNCGSSEGGSNTDPQLIPTSTSSTDGSATDGEASTQGQ